MRMLLFFALLCAVVSEQTDRIVGGLLVEEQTKYPAVVSLQFNERHICGGALVTSSWVLTAAHCVTFPTTFRPPINPNQLTIRYNSLTVDAGGEVGQIDFFVVHSGWIDQDQTKGYGIDLALLHLQTPSQGVAAFAEITNDAAAYQAENIISAVGWGAINVEGDLFERYLREVEFPIVPSDECNVVGDSLSHYFCAGVPGKDSCFGDSGGPVFINVASEEMEGLVFLNVVLGIVSFGTSVDCDGTYGGYLKVGNHLSWIEDVLDAPSTFKYHITPQDFTSNMDETHDDEDLLADLLRNSADAPPVSLCFCAFAILYLAFHL